MGQNMTDKTFHVLMVDDDEDDIFAIRRGIMSSKYNIDFASVSSADALFSLLKDGTHLAPDIILMDVNMPRMNGFEALERLKADDKWAEIPIMILSTSAHDVDSFKAKRLGAAGFATKFSSMNEMNEWVSSLEEFLLSQ